MKIGVGRLRIPGLVDFDVGLDAVIQEQGYERIKGLFV